MKASDYPLWQGEQVSNCIYAYVDNRNGKVYVGQAQDLERRDKFHRYKKRKVQIFDKELIKSPECFSLHVIEKDLDLSDLDNREAFWVKTFDSFHNGYNATETGHCLKHQKRFGKYKTKSTYEGKTRKYVVADDVHEYIKQHGGGKFLNDWFRAIMAHEAVNNNE